MVLAPGHGLGGPWWEGEWCSRALGLADGLGQRLDYGRPQRCSTALAPGHGLGGPWWEGEWCSTALGPADGLGQRLGHGRPPVVSPDAATPPGHPGHVPWTTLRGPQGS